MADFEEYERILGGASKIEIRLAEALSLVNADPTLVRQVPMNRGRGATLPEPFTGERLMGAVRETSARLLPGS